MFNGDLKNFASRLRRRRNDVFMNVVVVGCGKLQSNGVVEYVLCDRSAAQWWCTSSEPL